MMDNDDLPSAGMDPFASPPKEKRPRLSSRLWMLIVAGGLSTLVGCVMAFAGTSLQFENREDWEGFYAFLCLCPLPCLFVGIVLLMIGVMPILRRRQIEDSQSPST